MDKSHLLSTPMVVRTLDVKKDTFRPRDVDEEILGPEVSYLSAIGELMFLDGHTQPDIAFSLNLSARYSSYAGYMYDPHNGRSQIGYVFTSGAAILWRSVEQTIVATSSNHAEILAIHEASRECVWLRNATQHICRSCGISSENEAPTVLYVDNATCIAQFKECYIKGDITKHILPKFFFTHDLQKNDDIIVQQVRSSDNLADLFTKALPTSTFRKLIHNIGMRQLKDLKVFNKVAFLKRINGHPRESVMDKYGMGVHFY
nr:retrovirus-related Pol polyprotein from transposon TNT 1-94 [Tanacetum cinerariifolium]GEX41130.1 retrovirus-related Pol polyprotein from transposon TNT 1-94 [Tanacetum cinerariifolium]